MADDNIVSFPTSEPRVRPDVEVIFDLLRNADEAKLLELAAESTNFVMNNAQPDRATLMNDQVKIDALATAFFALGRILNVRMCMDETVTS